MSFWPLRLLPAVLAIFFPACKHFVSSCLSLASFFSFSCLHPQQHAFAFLASIGTNLFDVPSVPLVLFAVAAVAAASCFFP